MEQTAQQISQKPSLPIKTKIVAWYLRIAGIICIMVGTWILKITLTQLEEYFFSSILPLFILGSLLIFLSSYLFKGKKWAYLIAVALLIISSIPALFFTALSILAPGVPAFALGAPHIFRWGVPLLLISIFAVTIFLLLDRKNFWKITS